MFGLSERKRMEGWRGVSTCVFGYCGRVMEKKGGIYGEREDTRGYGNSEPDIVLNSGSHEKYKFLRDVKLKTVCQNVQGLGSLDILSDK